MTARGAAGAIAAVALALLWMESARRDDEPAAVVGRAGSPSATSQPARTAAVVPLRPALALPVLPASLRGTGVDGRLVANAAGELEPSHQVLRLFDYFLSSRGEQTLPEIRALIEAQAAGLPASAAADAMALFDSYVDWQGAVVDVAAESAAPRDYLDRVIELQQAYFGDRADDLFGRRNAIARASLDRQDHPGDAGAIDATLPPDIRRGLARTRAPHDVRARVIAMRASGATDAAVWEVRAEAFGAAAADRLAELDRGRR